MRSLRRSELAWLGLLALVVCCDLSFELSDSGRASFQTDRRAFGENIAWFTTPEENLRWFGTYIVDFDQKPTDVDAVVAGIPSRLSSLKQGMAPAEVLEELGIAPDRHWSWSGRGPPGAYTITYFLRTNRVLVLHFDMLTIPARFERARLEGDGWREFERMN